MYNTCADFCTKKNVEKNSAMFAKMMTFFDAILWTTKFAEIQKLNGKNRPIFGEVAKKYFFLNNEQTSSKIGRFLRFKFLSFGFVVKMLKMHKNMRISKGVISLILILLIDLRGLPIVLKRSSIVFKKGTPLLNVIFNFRK